MGIETNCLPIKIMYYRWQNCATLNTTQAAAAGCDGEVFVAAENSQDSNKIFAVPAARGSCCIGSSSAARVPVSALLQKKQDFSNAL